MSNLDEATTDQVAGKFIAYVRHELNDAAIEYESPLSQIQGGFETATYQFQLKGAPEVFDRRLVLRLYPDFRNPIDAAWTSIVQNALADQGQPVARAHSVCLDKSILGGAFFVMDFLDGEPMVTAPLETIPGMLATAHVDLHTTDAQSVHQALAEQGINEYVFGLDRQFEFLQDSAKELPWIGEGVDWLLENRPAVPEHLTLCHGDFHPQNILIRDGEVTGVVDWSGFLITDPAMDIANTTWLITVAYKFLASGLFPDFGSESGPDFAAVDWEEFSQQYLDAYRALLPIDSTNLEYYRVVRSILALMEGVRGHEALQQPLIVEDLVDFTYKSTGIRITMPD